MTTFGRLGPATSQHAPTGLGPRSAESRVAGLAWQLWYPSSAVVVVHVVGELDVRSAPRLQEVLVSRLSSTVETVILDLHELQFLGVAGLEVLAHARRCAARREKAVCIVDGPVCVDRALRAAGWREDIPAYSSVAAAVAELTGRHRESLVRVAG